MSVVQSLYLAKFMQLQNKGFDPNQIVGMIDDNSLNHNLCISATRTQVHDNNAQALPRPHQTQVA